MTWPQRTADCDSVSSSVSSSHIMCNISSFTIKKSDQLYYLIFNYVHRFLDWIYIYNKGIENMRNYKKLILTEWVNIIIPSGNPMFYILVCEFHKMLVQTC